MTKAWESPDILLHVGLHKTGTTLLEQTLFCRPDSPHFHAVADKERLYGTTLAHTKYRYTDDEARAPLLPDAEAAQRAGKTLALLGETWLGRPFVHMAIREANLARIHSLFPNARALVTFREQSSLVLSMYGQYVRFGNSPSLAEFVAAPPRGSSFTGILQREAYDFLQVHALCCDVFGADRVLMLPFEMILRDPDMLLARLGQSIGRDLSAEGPLNTEKRVNAALSPLAFDIMRHANRFSNRDTPWLSRRRRAFPNALGARVDRLVWSSWRQRQQRAALALVKAELGDHYRSSNAALADKLGIDLAGYGYTV